MLHLPHYRFQKPHAAFKLNNKKIYKGAEKPHTVPVCKVMILLSELLQ